MLPNARVVFRRRVAEAPVTMQINADRRRRARRGLGAGLQDDALLADVRSPDAPERRTSSKGTGIVEATEEDTLVALGEVIMVKDTAPAVAAVSATTETETTAPVATATTAAKCRGETGCDGDRREARCRCRHRPRRWRRAASVMAASDTATPAEPAMTATETTPADDQAGRDASRRSRSRRRPSRPRRSRPSRKPRPTPSRRCRSCRRTSRSRAGEAGRGRRGARSPAIDKATVSSVVSRRTAPRCSSASPRARRRTAR